jgi:cytosine deaminase
MSFDTILRAAVTPDDPTRRDFGLRAGRIAAIAPQLDASAAQEFDLAGRLLSAGFVDPHVHLDIALISPGMGRERAFRSPVELNDATNERRRAFTEADIVQRAGAALELACRHGITAVRSQCHVDQEVGLKHVHALQQVKEQYADRVTLQIVAFPQMGLSAPGTRDLFRAALREGADVMGCGANLDPNGDLRAHIDAAFALAQELDVDIDAHADLSLRWDEVRLEELESVYLAQRAIEVGYQGRVTAGHLNTLDSATPAVAAQAIEWIARAEMTVISQPDLYRLGRTDEQHVRRGLTRVKALLAAGVNVAFASNNVRDAYRPLGNLDPLEEALILAYGAHMDTTADLATLLRMATVNPARALKLADYGLAEGCAADLVVLEAATAAEAVARQAEKRWVFKRGRLVAENEVIRRRY